MPFRPGKLKTGGRKPGQPNHLTQLLKDTILEAATRAGKGDIVAYLERQAEENPVAFLSLLGRVLPLQLQTDRDQAGKGDIVAYLERQAEENPVALSLLGRVLPLQLQTDRDRPLVISRVEYVIVDPKGAPA